MVCVFKNSAEGLGTLSTEVPSASLLVATSHHTYQCSSRSYHIPPGVKPCNPLFIGISLPFATLIIIFRIYGCWNSIFHESFLISRSLKDLASLRLSGQSECVNKWKDAITLWDDEYVWRTINVRQKDSHWMYNTVITIVDSWVDLWDEYKFLIEMVLSAVHDGGEIQEKMAICPFIPVLAPTVLGSGLQKWK